MSKKLHDVREELDRTWRFQQESENAVLAQRRRAAELDALFGEERRNDQSLPHHLRERA